MRRNKDANKDLRLAIDLIVRAVSARRSARLDCLNRARNILDCVAADMESSL